MYRIVNDDNKFYVQITEDEHYERTGVDSNVGYATLGKFEGVVYRGSLSFNSKEDAEAHIKTLNHTEWCIPDKARSKLKGV